MRRIQKRMQTVGIQSYSNYIDYLEVHPDEFQQLFNTILINVTAFFRDRPAWDYITTEILPQIVASKLPGKPIRVWSAGCASGEETYTLAIVLAENLGFKAFGERVKIFATDIDEEAINQARQASYNEKEVAEVSPELLEKYCDRSANRYVFNKELRRSIIFGRHNLLTDAPIGRIDLLVCRNTLMYFNTDGQNQILERFHFALNGGGFLFLGKAEVLFTRNNTFTPIDLKMRVFTKVPKNGLRRDRLLKIRQPEDAIEPINRRGKTFPCKITCTPLKDKGTEVQGVVLLMEDILHE